MSRVFSDNLRKLTEQMTPEAVRKSFEHNGITFRKKDSPIALRVIDEKEEIQTWEQFNNALIKIKSGKVLQTLLALWAYTNEKGNFIFNGVRLSKIMKTVLKTKTGNFSQPEKRGFTKAVQHLRDFEISLDQTITDTDERGKKKKVIKRDFYKLIDLTGATYAKRNKDVIDPDTGEVIFKKGEANEDVIIKLYGELLPRFNKGITQGRLYSRGLLKLDANKDDRAILLGFKLLTRFDQRRNWRYRTKEYGVPDRNLHIRVDRKTLIKWAGYEQTDSTNKTIANQMLYCCL